MGKYIRSHQNYLRMLRKSTTEFSVFHEVPLSNQTIKRRFFKFLRFHKIPYQQECGNFYMGSAVINIVNGELCVFFPRVGKLYGNIVSFKVEWSDPYNVYLKLSRLHNKLMVAFPMAKTKFLPDLFD